VEGDWEVGRWGIGEDGLKRGESVVDLWGMGNGEGFCGCVRGGGGGEVADGGSRSVYVWSLLTWNSSPSWKKSSTVSFCIPSH
jgi:hypothetical protein